MRRSAVLTTLALAASTVVLAQPAHAMKPLEQSRTAAKAKVECVTGVVGVDSERHVRYDTVRNNKITNLSRSKAKLGFDVTAWGFFDSETTGKKRVLRLDAVTTKGPRRIAISFTGDKDKITDLASTKYEPKDFKPDVFADGAGYFGYTVEENKLVRWSLTRGSSGSVYWARESEIGTGYGSLTALTSTAFYTIKGVVKEVLYGVFADGSLAQIQVPFKKPQKTKVKYIASTGYAGVTEMSMSICNDKSDYHSIVAIDPVAGTATWTTVQDITGKAKATLRGEITGGADWNLSAVY